MSPSRQRYLFVWATFDVPEPADSIQLFSPESMDPPTLGAVDCLLLANDVTSTIAGLNAEGGYVNTWLPRAIVAIGGYVGRTTVELPTTSPSVP